MDKHTAYWKRAHHDWRFWVGVVLVVAAMIVYVMTDNLSLRPRVQRQPPPAAPIRGSAA
jgi:hypothetical protein